MSETNKRKHKTGEAQLIASRKYREKDPENFKRIDYRSKAKMFMKNYANDDEILEFLSLYASDNLKSNKKIKDFYNKLLNNYINNFAGEDDLILLIQKFNEKTRGVEGKDIISILSKS